MSEDRDLKFVPLAYFASAPEAQMARELLANNGIAVLLQGANFGALEPLPMTGGFSEITLLVPEAEKVRAQELYDAFFANEDTALAEGEEVVAEADDE